METRKQSRWVMPVILLMLLGPIVWVSATFVVMSRKAEALNVGCTNNLKQLASAFESYAKQHNGRLPDAARWTEQLQPYLRDPGVLRCPADRSGKGTSYAMNRYLSGRPLYENRGAAQTVLLYETKNPGTNPSGTGKDAFDIGRNTKGRHYQTASRFNYLLTTGLKVIHAGREAELKKLQWDVAASK